MTAQPNETRPHLRAPAPWQSIGQIVAQLQVVGSDRLDLNDEGDAAHIDPAR